MKKPTEEEKKERKEKWRKENPEKMKEYKKKWNKKNPEKVRASKAKWYKKNKERVIAKSTLYQKNNKEKVSERNSKSYYKSKEEEAKWIAEAMEREGIYKSESDYEKREIWTIRRRRFRSCGKVYLINKKSKKIEKEIKVLRSVIEKTIASIRENELKLENKRELALQKKFLFALKKMRNAKKKEGKKLLVEKKKEITSIRNKLKSKVYMENAIWQLSNEIASSMSGIEDLLKK